MSDRIINVDLRRAEVERFSYAIADVLCWLSGFRAGSRGEVDLPPGWDALRDLNIKLKRRLDDDGDDQPL